MHKILRMKGKWRTLESRKIMELHGQRVLTEEDQGDETNILSSKLYIRISEVLVAHQPTRVLLPPILYYGMS